MGTASMGNGCCAYDASVCGGCPSGCFCAKGGSRYDINGCSSAPVASMESSATCECYLRDAAITAGIFTAVCLGMVILGIFLYVRSRKAPLPEPCPGHGRCGWCFAG